MSDVFVSYKAEDRPRIQPLVDALEADGLSVWWDAHIGGGVDWRETIARHLEDARCVIVAWSIRSIASEGRFVRDEATRALRRKAYLPIRLDEVDPPLGFGESQALALIGWKGDRSDARYAAVLAAARTMIGLAPSIVAPSAPPPARGVDRRAMIAGGGVLAAAAAGGGWYMLRGDRVISNSIAVLPFANLSGDPAQAYFSDGIAEEVRNALSRIARLKVVARTSSEMLRDADAKTAARKLDVANILTGSVRRSASTIRVSAQLIDGRNGLELWSQSFDRPFGDILQIQSGIAISVAEALSIRLHGADRTALSLGGTRNAAAQDLLLKSMPRNTEDGEAGLLRRLGLIDAAIALDPHYAEAFARKAFGLNGYASLYAHSVAEAHARQSEAIGAARRALAIEPRLGLGYIALGAIYRNQLDIARALEMFRRALALPGTDVGSLGAYATLLSQSNRFDQALQLNGQATRLDPLDPFEHELHILILYQAGRFSEVVTYAAQNQQIGKGRDRFQGFLGLALYMLGKDAAAARQFAALPQDNIHRLTGNAFLAARKGDRATTEQFRQAVFRRYSDAAHYQYAQIDAQLGDKDRAFAELEQAWTMRDSGLASVRVDPLLGPLKDDPRFAAVVKKLNFP